MSCLILLFPLYGFYIKSLCLLLQAMLGALDHPANIRTSERKVRDFIVTAKITLLKKEIEILNIMQFNIPQSQT